MPVVLNPLVSPPSNHNERAWRYMDFAKFVALISRRPLFLCNLETLAKADGAAYPVPLPPLVQAAPEPAPT